VAVVGAGTVGLATAWFQQEAGVQVTRPLLSAAASRRVFVAGGHGMWDVALGPATGQLLAQSVLEGEAPRS